MNINRRQLLLGIGWLGFLVSGFLPRLLAEQQANGENSSEPILRFAAVADTGMGDNRQYSVANAIASYYKQKPFPMVVLAGDNIYGSGEISRVDEVFTKPYAPLLGNGVKFRAVLGNHDVLSNDGVDELKYAAFNMSGGTHLEVNRYYTFRQKNVDFFALDTNASEDWAIQLNWLTKSLAKSKAPWKIVFGHHPVYSSGMHGGTKILARDLPPLFAQYGVQLYLCGHDHNYERSQNLKGTTYIVHGAGANTRSVGKSDFTAYSEAKLSFIVVEVTAQEIRTEAIGIDGKVFDRTGISLKSV
jgi:predicted MPP superfamily phosphohydrolase